MRPTFKNFSSQHIIFSSADRLSDQRNPPFKPTTKHTTHTHTQIQYSTNKHGLVVRYNNSALKQCSYKQLWPGCDIGYWFYVKVIRNDQSILQVVQLMMTCFIRCQYDCMKMHV